MADITKPLPTPNIFVKEIVEKYTQENFKRLTDYFLLQNQLLDFQFFEVVFTKAETKKIAHTLGKIPKDILKTHISGAGVVTFNYYDFTDSFISITSTGAAKVRFFAGLYWADKSSEPIGKTDDEDFVATSDIATSRILDGAVTTAKIAASSVTTSKISDEAVTTDKLADGSVTPVKKSSLGQQISDSSGVFSTSSATFVDATNLSVTITTTGRPVFVGIMHDGGGSVGYLEGNDTTGSASYVCGVGILRNSTIISQQQYHNIYSGTAATLLGTLPLGAVWHIDTPSAGTYTYKIQIYAGTGDSARIYYGKLVAFEL